MSGLVTTTFAAPALPEGRVQAMVVAFEEARMTGHAEPPTVTVGPVKKLVPVIVRVPVPASGPAVGETPEIVGAL